MIVPVRSGGRSQIWAGLPTIALLAALLYGLLGPEPPPILFAGSDKWEHLLAFCLLGLCGRRAWPGDVSVVWLWVGLLILAGLLEWLQGAVQAHRTLSFADAGANLLGVMLALAVVSCWQRVAGSRLSGL